ncbi:DUF6193 family natural product biosynthesis protein [Streptomyces sp. NPDC021212]|uniref:DUF6193 family natural product biosynthesis protein n=1 Tax=Streptomyces sp. NPDC021212 TaxID=3365118 RepID=UPI0037A308C5
MIDPVESAWRRLLQTAGDSGPFSALVLASSAQPLLRRLYPWTGMWELHFSRCTEPRYTWDIPYVAPSYDRRFRVDGPSRSESVGEARSVDEALAMVIDRLPPGCGPAFVGTPQELAMFEEERGVR